MEKTKIKKEAEALSPFAMFYVENDSLDISDKLKSVEDKLNLKYKNQLKDKQRIIAYPSINKENPSKIDFFCHITDYNGECDNWLAYFQSLNKDKVKQSKLHHDIEKLEQENK